MLNLYHVHWEEDAISTGATMLAASLPRLQILNAPFEALVCDTSLIRNAALAGPVCAQFEKQLCQACAFHPAEVAELQAKPTCNYSREPRPEQAAVAYSCQGDKDVIIALHVGVQAPAVVDHTALDSCCSYELRDLPQRRLRRWPRQCAPGYTYVAGATRLDPSYYWPVLDKYRWPWKG